MLIRDVELATEANAPRVDVRIRRVPGSATIAAIGSDLEAAAGEPIVHGAGGALLPGLHDHHIHLLALAAASRSVRCGPPDVTDREGLARAIAGASAPARPPGADERPAAWIRGVGYFESVAGDLDAGALSQLAPGRPVRVQHRSGALWILNQRGLETLGLADRLPDDAPSGAERDAQGRSTGRFFRADAWLRQLIEDPGPPDLAETGAMLARYGVTGVTDATPGNGAFEADLFAGAIATSRLPLAVRMMGLPSLAVPLQPGLQRGAVKLVLDDTTAIDPDSVVESVRNAHEHDRPVAIHCVTRTELVVALAALAAVGARPDDRIEHASIAPPELARQLAQLGVTVVTQPNFVRERGDAYLRDVDPSERPWLYRCQGLLDAGVALGGGTDAPFGNPNPWAAMQAAVDRRTAAGAVLGAEDALRPERALALFTSAPEAPGGPPRHVTVGVPADLCLLDRPWSRARDALDAGAVVATWHQGQLTWHAGLADGAAR